MSKDHDPYYEIFAFYFIAERNAEAVARFIEDHRLKAAWEELAYPEFSDVPEAVFRSSQEALEYLLREEASGLTLHYHDPSGRLYSLIFAHDGHVIFGIPYYREDPARISRTVAQYGGISGFVSDDLPDYAGMDAFARGAERNPIARYGDGRLSVLDTLD